MTRALRRHPALRHTAAGREDAAARQQPTGLAVIDDGILHETLLRGSFAEQTNRQIILADHNHPE
jgi:hypothetical protein